LSSDFSILNIFWKSLAFDKVKEKVESIGFKYVDLKETYKNFKGNLKEQTERLAMTTQHDGFYLVGNKSNETEKVFNFLFDSTEVANAIAQVTIDLKIEHDTLNKYTLDILEDTKKLEQEKISYDIYVYKYYLSLINTHISYVYVLENLNHTKHLLTDIHANLQGYVNITTGILNIDKLNADLIKLKTNNKIYQMKLIDELISFETYLQYLNHYFQEKQKSNENKNRLIVLQNDFDKYIKMESLSSEISNLKFYSVKFKSYIDDINTIRMLDIDKLRQKIIIIDELINLENVKKLFDLNIDQLITLSNKFDNQKELYNSLQVDLSELDNIYNIHVCNTCNGTGHIIGE